MKLFIFYFNHVNNGWKFGFYQWSGQICISWENMQDKSATRKYCYDDVLQYTQRAITDGKSLLKVLHDYQNYM